MLLAGPGHGKDLAQGHPVGLHPAEQQVQGLGPHLGRAVFDQWVGIRQHAVDGPVAGQAGVEVQGVFVDHLAGIVIDHDGGEALGTRIQTEK